MDQLSYSVEDTAKMLGFGRDSLYRAMRQGKIKGVSFGRRTMFRREEIERFLNSLPAHKLDVPGRGRPRDPNAARRQYDTPSLPLPAPVTGGQRATA